MKLIVTVNKNQKSVLFLFAQIRKTRSLTELINEAEETLSNPINQVSMGLVVISYLKLF